MDGMAIAAVSGIRSRMESLDLLANNLANAGTAGFKRDQEFYGLFTSDEASGAGDNPSSTMPMIQRQWTDFSPGNLQVTGNPMDVALSGTGFFAVNGKNGPLYTRNGSLQVLASGALATADGYPLRNTAGGTIQITSGSPIEVQTDGTVRQNGQPLGQIEVVNFKSTDSLYKAGSTCFQNTNPKNLPVQAPDTQVQQGKLEGSNVPVAEAAMSLVGVMRQFEMLQKAIGVSSDMDTKTIQEVARVGS
ncbi:Flagellar basal body rod protein [Candidatus Sulfopaludibacter sp. SbA3]|nr:Flagellar basal body rod protein [Candidatus Sulfopaludibacter sp. SbA3]